MTRNVINLFIPFCLLINGLLIEGTDYDENWTGRWFPESPTNAPSFAQRDRVPMGITNPDCDDAQKLIEVDWFDDPSPYSCYDNKYLYKPNKKIRPIYEKQHIPPFYMANHSCMNESLEYDQQIPTFGTHRPLWPVWGEYLYVPPQRWLHNLEHGGVVMLYHPCASLAMIDKLRSIVVRCLYRHVITPYPLLTPERPLALVVWGSHLQMSVVSKRVVVDFIKDAALRGPEQTARDGQYSHKLIRHAKIVTTESDDTLCPNM